MVWSLDVFEVLSFFMDEWNLWSVFFFLIVGQLLRRNSRIKRRGNVEGGTIQASTCVFSIESCKVHLSAIFPIGICVWFWMCLCRWFTYLNSDFKKGGWSPEEDMLLCEVIDLCKAHCFLHYFKLEYVVSIANFFQEKHSDSFLNKLICSLLCQLVIFRGKVGIFVDDYVKMHYLLCWFYSAVVHVYVNSYCSWIWSNNRSGSQAQKIFGNRWTEIAKVVSGRLVYEIIKDMSFVFSGTFIFWWP